MQNLNKKTFSIILLSVVVLLVIFSPTLVQGKEKITNIWAGTGEGGVTCNERGMNCTFCDGIIVTTNIIELLLLLGVTLGVLIILYGGVRLMTSGGSQTQIKEAKDIIVKAIIGVVIVSCAWIIVDTIFKTFAKDSKWNALQFIGCGSSDLKIATKGEPKIPDMKTFAGDTITKQLTKEEREFEEKITEGSTMSPPSVCKPVTYNNEKENGFVRLLKSVFADDYEQRILKKARSYKGKLEYSNETNDKKKKYRGNLDSEPHGYADCSSFTYSVYACAAGFKIGKNTTELATKSLPSELGRTFINKKWTNQDIWNVIRAGNIVGFDATCRNDWKEEVGLEPNSTMGHVMIVSAFKNGKLTIIHQTGRDGVLGVFEESPVKDYYGPWRKCGYIIYIK